MTATCTQLIANCERVQAAIHIGNDMCEYCEADVDCGLVLAEMSKLRRVGRDVQPAMCLQLTFVNCELMYAAISQANHEQVWAAICSWPMFVDCELVLAAILIVNDLDDTAKLMSTTGTHA